MAVFPEPGAAVRVALAALGDTGPPLRLKVGIHRGPVIAAVLDERPDYLGQTVNIAARLCALAKPDGLRVSREVHEAPGVGELLAWRPMAAEAGELFGIDGPRLPLLRLASPPANNRSVKGDSRPFPPT